MTTGAVVTFQIKLLNYGNTSNPFFIISKQVPVVNGSASAIFESLPTTTILGQIHIENGKIQGYSDFHGALDLIQGENTVTLAPVGSLMPQDVVAKALSEIISSSTLFLSAPQSLVFELNNIVSVLLLDSSAAYSEVINNFTNRNGLPVVELVSPTTNQTFVAGDNIAIIASATDMDGSISKVEFFQGTNKVGEALALPFFCTWKPLSAGYYSLTAKAFDNNSAVGVTSPVIIQVISKETPAGYTVTYNGNGNTGGSVPTDNLAYQQNATVTVKDNAGSLVKTGYTFAGWNTAADGSGTSYNPAATFTMGSANVTLYAKWSLVPAYTVTYNGNGNTGGSVPADNLTYQQSATVTVKDNTGSLVKTGYTFVGWNATIDGSGMNYSPSATFTMSIGRNVTLYAKWQRFSGKVICVATGLDFSIFLREDGSVWATGNNTYGQLGDNTFFQRLSPVQVGSLTNIRKIVTGQSFSLALSKDGKLWGWGDNSYNTINANGALFNTPQSVHGLENIKDVTVSGSNCMALDDIGQVWVWGRSSLGSLDCPELVPNLKDIIAISCGTSFAIALKSDGTIWAWGANSNGELGNGMPSPGLTLVPAQVIEVENIVKIAAGPTHCLALKSSGELWAWGSNLTGQLGIGSTITQYSPVFVCSTSSLSSLFASAFRSHFLTENGEVWSWGRGLGHSLGSLDRDDLSPVKRSLIGIEQVAFNNNRGFYINRDGDLYGWGNNFYGELGLGITSAYAPFSEIAFPAD